MAPSATEPVALVQAPEEPEPVQERERGEVQALGWGLAREQGLVQAPERERALGPKPVQELAREPEQGLVPDCR